MDHNDVRHALADYLDESLGPKDRAAVEEHLMTCSSCANALAELRKTIEHVRSLDEVEPPTWMKQKIMARVREEAGKARKPAYAWFPRGFRFPLEVLGVALLAMTVFFIYRNMQPPRVQEGQPHLQPVSEAVPPPVAGEHPRRIEPSQQTPAAPPTGLLSKVTATVQNKSPELRAKAEIGIVRDMLRLRIRARGKDSPARFEEAVRNAGGKVVSKDLSSDAWVMTVEIDRSKHDALLSALKRIGRTEERTLAIDGREGREILVNSEGRKPAVGC